MKWDSVYLGDTVSFGKSVLGEAVEERMKNAVIKTRREDYNLNIAFRMWCSKDWWLAFWHMRQQSIDQT